jgi:hypothetical protein
MYAIYLKHEQEQAQQRVIYPFFPPSRVTLVFTKLDVFHRKMKEEYTLLRDGRATFEDFLPARAALYRSSGFCPHWM